MPNALTKLIPRATRKSADQCSVFSGLGGKSFLPSLAPSSTASLSDRINTLFSTSSSIGSSRSYRSDRSSCASFASDFSWVSASLSVTSMPTTSERPRIFAPPLPKVQPPPLPPRPAAKPARRPSQRRRQAPLQEKRDLLCVIIAKETCLPEHTVQGIKHILAQAVPDIFTAPQSLYIDVDDLPMDTIDQLYSWMVGHRV